MLCDLLQEHGTRLLRPELRLDIAFLNNPKSSFGVKRMTFTKGREANQNFRVTDDGKVAVGFSRKNHTTGFPLWSDLRSATVAKSLRLLPMTRNSQHRKEL